MPRYAECPLVGSDTTRANLVLACETLPAHSRSKSSPLPRREGYHPPGIGMLASMIYHNDASTTSKQGTSCSTKSAYPTMP